MRVSARGRLRRMYTHVLFDWRPDEPSEKVTTMKVSADPEGQRTFSFESTAAVTMTGDYRVTLHIDEADIHALMLLASLSPSKRKNVLAALRKQKKPS
ncbi:MAG: hypothetical protein H6886_07490 [Hyphomicrobiaceae bacterium]|nr:hypothetical protein [Hyphomicrobiaceae bacterium]